MLVGEGFRLQGYTVAENHKPGPDEGIDLILRQSGECTSCSASNGAPSRSAYPLCESSMASWQRKVPQVGSSLPQAGSPPRRRSLRAGATFDSSMAPNCTSCSGRLRVVVSLVNLRNTPQEYLSTRGPTRRSGPLRCAQGAPVDGSTYREEGRQRRTGILGLFGLPPLSRHRIGMATGVHLLVDLENVQPSPKEVEAWLGDAGEAWVFYGPEPAQTQGGLRSRQPAIDAHPNLTHRLELTGFPLGVLPRLSGGQTPIVPVCRSCQGHRLRPTDCPCTNACIYVRA